MESKQRSASRELVINTIIFGIGTLASKIIMFMLLPIYTAYMTTSELGTGELVVNCMNLLYPIATINILSAMLRYAMDVKSDKKKVLQNTFIVILIGVMVVAMGMSVINLQSSINKWKVYLLLLLFCYSLEQILSVFSKALDKTKIFAIGNIIYTLALFVISAILLSVFHRGTAGYLEGMILANIITFLYYIKALNIRQYITLDKIDKPLLKEMVLFSIPLIVNSISWWIASFCDRFVLELYLGTNSVGIYSVASKIPAIVSTVASVFMQAWVLSAIKEYQRGGESGFFDAVFRKFSALFISWAAIIICLCKLLMTFLASGDFLESWLYVPLLLCAAVFSGFGNFYSALYISAKKNTSVMITTICGAVVNIVLNFILIPNMGIQGAVIATMISQLVVVLFRMIDSRRFIIFRVDYIRLAITVLLLLFESYTLLYCENMIFAVIICFIVLVIYFVEIKQLIIKMIKSVERIRRR